MRAPIAQYADRPFTDSEVRFLKYIRQWGKKVVFLVNKVDILSDSAEVSALGPRGRLAHAFYAALPLIADACWTWVRRQATQPSLAE